MRRSSNFKAGITYRKHYALKSYSHICLQYNTILHFRLNVRNKQEFSFLKNVIWNTLYSLDSQLKQSENRCIGTVVHQSQFR
jgi:hypothetical protein